MAAYLGLVSYLKNEEATENFRVIIVLTLREGSENSHVDHTGFTSFLYYGSCITTRSKHNVVNTLCKISKNLGFVFYVS